MQENTYKYKQIQTNTNKYKQIQTNTNKYKQIQTNTNKYKQNLNAHLSDRGSQSFKVVKLELQSLINLIKHHWIIGWMIIKVTIISFHVISSIRGV